MYIRGVFCVCIILVAASLVGCGPPAVAPANRELVGSLRTAISAKKH